MEIIRYMEGVHNKNIPYDEKIDVIKEIILS